MLSNNKIDNQILSLYKEGDSKKDIIKFIFDNQLVTKLDIAGDDGNTLLHLASERGDVDTVNYILSYIEINPNMKGLLNLLNRDRNTPAHLAVKNNHQIIASLLEDAGADFSIKNSNGEYIKLQDMDNPISKDLVDKICVKYNISPEDAKLIKSVLNKYVKDKFPNLSAQKKLDKIMELIDKPYINKIKLLIDSNKL